MSSNRPRFGSGFEQLESREVPTASSANFQAMLGQLGVSDQIRVALLDIHDENATLADSLLAKHTTVASLESAVVSLSGSQTYTGIGSIAPTSPDRFAPFLTSGFKLSLDVNPANISYGALVTKYNSYIGDTAFHLAMRSTGHLAFTVYSGGLARGIETNSPVLSANAWQHVEAVFDRPTQTFTVTVNGTSVPVTVWGDTIPTLTNGNAPIRIGSHVNGNGIENGGFNGQIRDVRISLPHPVDAGPVQAERNALLDQIINLEIVADALDASQDDAVDQEANSPVQILTNGQIFSGIGSVTPTTSDHFAPFTSNFAFHAEINPSTLANGVIGSKYDSSIGDSAFYFRLGADGRLTLYVYGAGGVYSGVETTSPVITTNAWQSVTGSYNGQLEIRVNGQVVPTSTLIQNTIGEIPNGQAPIRVGTAVNGNGAECNPFSGQIRNAALTAFGANAPTFEQSSNTADPPPEEEEPSDIPPARQWESGESFDLHAILARNRIVMLRGGETVGGGTYVSIDNYDNDSKYMRIDAEALSGSSVELREVLYVNESGLHRLPDEYFERHGHLMVLIKPNAPHHLVVGVAGNNARILFQQRADANRDELIPPPGMSVSLTTLSTREPTAEGWVDWPATVPSKNVRANAGGSVNMLFGMRNIGLGEGNVTMRVRIGSGATNDPIVKQYTGNIGAQSQRALSVNVNLPQDFATVTFEVEDSQGNIIRQQTRVQTPRHQEQREGWVDAYTWNRNAVAIAHASDPDGGAAALVNYDLAWGKLSSANQTVVQQAQAELVNLGAEVGGSATLAAATGFFDAIDRPDQALTFGSSLNESLQQKQSHSLQFYWNEAASSAQLSFPVRSDMAAGRVFLGILAAYKNGSLSQQLMASGVNMLMGIPSSEILLVRNTEAGMSAEDLRDVFVDHGYGYLFSSNAIVAPNGPYIRNVGTRVAFSGRLVSLSLDTGGGIRYSRGEVYVRNLQGELISAAPLLSFTDTLTVDVPVQQIADLYGGQIHGDFVLEVVLKDGVGHSFSGAHTSDVIPVDTLVPTKNLSTNPDERMRAIENYIFSNVAFPLENTSAWHQTFGSALHRNHGFESFDLNMNVEDGGQPIHAMASGRIISVGFYSEGASHVDILHEADISLGGQMQHIKWVSKYLHMPMTKITNNDGTFSYVMTYNGGSVTLQEGMQIQQGQIIAGVGNVGASKNHSHVSGHVIENGIEQDAINFNPYLRDLGIVSKVEIPSVGGEERELTWNEGAQEWSYEADGIYYHRNEDGSEHFLAMTGGKEEIVWDIQRNAWVKANDPSPTEKWQNGSWLSL